MTHSVEFQVQLLSDRGTLPTSGSDLAAGVDLYAAEDKIIPARGKALVDLQLSIAVPEGHYGRVAPRSGLAAKHSIQTGAGVIDADYRGPVMVLLFNHSDVDFEVKAKDRIAQLILERISVPKLKLVDQLDSTTRGAGGFGSTGGFGNGSAQKKQKLENGEAAPVNGQSEHAPEPAEAVETASS